MNVTFGFAEEPKGKTSSWFKQVHGNRVLCLDDSAKSSEEADGGYTRQTNREIFVFTADCIPLLLYGKESGAPIAALHCGWRSTLKGIARSALSQWDYPAKESYAVIGPAIGVCCFEVREDFLDAFRKASRPVEPYVRKSSGGTTFDLVRFLVEQELGDLPRRNIDLSFHRCTVCSQPSLPSFRRNKGTDPHLRSWILKSSPNA